MLIDGQIENDSYKAYIGEVSDLVFGIPPCGWPAVFPRPPAITFTRSLSLSYFRVSAFPSQGSKLCDRVRHSTGAMGDSYVFAYNHHPACR